MNVAPSAVLQSRAILFAAFLVPPLLWARPNSAIQAFNEGVKLFNAKEFNGAIPKFDDAISGDSDFADAYFARGACKYYLKSLDAAVLDLNDALRLKPDYLDALALRGAVNYESDRWDDALADFNAVLQKNPTDAQSLLGRAVILLKREDWNRAARDFRGFLRVRPNDPLAPKVRSLLASLDRRPHEQENPEVSGTSNADGTPPPSPTVSHRREVSSAELQKMAESLLSHPLSESYDQKMLRGEKTQAVGDFHSIPGTPDENKKSDSGVEIVEPQ
jgi:tetratricopeptide (TPR) repeat protein